MDGADDGLLLVSHVLEDSHYVLGHERVQTGSGFVTEHDGWVGEHLKNREYT